ncbi:cytochrome c biogenesis protein CcdA [Ochrobactrum sp. MR28]|nr:cytochrome c biogenesis protein CcdA [Ochrobactrum sp. MR28]MBX8818306.1 cytochrome c biogenesis protein CcdA [Ochrobactrum sp. MR31]
MAVDISILTALGAGALSFLSPCVLPLVPPYLCYMAGVSVDDFRNDKESSEAMRNRIRLLMTAFTFVLGFTTIFVALGASATSIGHLLRQWQQEMAIAAGLIIILMGLNFLGLIRIPFLSREARFQANSAPATPLGAYVMGLAFAFGWTPCIGPVLGPILSMASVQASVADGVFLLFVYSMGLGIPFMLAALFSGRFMRFLARFRMHMGKVEKVMGVLLVLAGILFLTGGMQAFAWWLLEIFPILGKIG